MRVTFFIGLLSSFTAVSAIAAECTVAARSENIVFLSCSADSVSETWVESAKKACGDDASCNVWIWKNDVKLPATAPLTDAEIPKALTSTALAVWANDSANLLTLKNVKAKPSAK